MAKPTNQNNGNQGPNTQAIIEKPKNAKQTFNRLMVYLSKFKISLILVIMLALLSTVFTIVSPKIMSKAINELARGYVDTQIVKFVDPIDKAIIENSNSQSSLKIMAEKTPNQTLKELLLSLNPNQDLSKIPQNVQDLTLTKLTNLEPKTDLDYIKGIVYLLLVLYAISSLFSYIMNLIMAGVTQKVVYNLRKETNEKINKLPLSYFDSRTYGEILSRMTNDIDQIQNALQQGVTTVITSAALVVGILIMMFSINIILAILSTIGILLTGAIMGIIMGRSQGLFKKQQQTLGELNGHIEEMYSSHIVIKSYNGEKRSIETFEKLNQSYQKTAAMANFVSSVIMPLLNFISNLTYLVIAVLGGIFITQGKITIGDIQALIQYSRQVGQPVGQISQQSMLLQSAIAGAERVFEILDEKEESVEFEENNITSEITGDIEIKNVAFSYDPEIPLLSNFTASVKQGQTIAIVGPTGAGKTTFINLLMRFYEIDKGSILLNGIDLSKSNRADIRGNFGMVLQDTWLFNDTIAANIGYGIENATREDIINAAKSVKADHFIKTLPHGYDTILNEDGSNISQGQKQLLTIARVVLANPKILILDEATSNIDSRTEILIQKAMNKLMIGRTSFVIAHRLSTIKNADIILVLDKGNIIEQGTHDELLEKKGFYSELYLSQFA